MEKHIVNSQRYDIETRIKEEQVRLLFHQIPFVVYLPPVSGAILAFLLWGHVNEATIIIWLVVVFCANTLLGSWVLWSYKKSEASITPDLWLHRLIVFSIVCGIAWGIGGYVLFTPDTFNYLGLLFLWMYLPAATGTMISLAYSPLFYAIVLTMLTPITIRCLQESDTFYLTLALTTVIYIGCLKYFHNHIHRILMESMRLRFEKDNLLHEVTLGKEAAERANIAKSRFLAAANHDLRQPLHAQTLFVAELKHRIKDKESVKLMERLESTIKSMSELFNVLLDISKLDAATVDCNIKAWPMSMFLEGLETQFATTVSDKGLNFRVVPCAQTIYSDRSLLARMLQNLVANAIKYTDSGSVMVCCRQAGRELRIEVRDSGTGIAEDKHTQIFDEFVQLHNPERDRNKGLGLGLAIVSRLGQLLEHEINVHSSPGKGSVFSVTVPICEQPSYSSLGTTNTNADAIDINGVRILVIDNESSIRVGTQRLLRAWGCLVVTASGLDDAIQTLAMDNIYPQVIISDYRLPGNKTGIDTLNQLREHIPNDVLGILITGDIALDVLREADASGYHVLHKPVSLEKLRQLVSLSTQDIRN